MSDGDGGGSWELYGTERQIEPEPTSTASPTTTWRTAGSAAGTSGGIPGGRTGTSGGGTGLVLGAVLLGLAVVMLVIALTAQSRGVGPNGPGIDVHQQCAAAHDEDNSLFSDAEWCDLELNGGDGDDDLTDMGGVSDEGGFDVEDYLP